ncbi:MAG: thioesterase family protein [Oleiphilaceae bacterium]|nr:thioesterase family protein [Oleiphilaceae bacterium]
MPNETISFPDHVHHAIDYRVVYSDINAANHLGADRVLPIALEAQFSFIRKLGYEDSVVFENAGLIMVNSHIDYLSEGHYGDRLRVEMAIEKVSDKAVDFIYRIHNTTTQKEVARVKTRLLFFDYDVNAVTTIPEGFVARLAQQGIAF